MEASGGKNLFDSKKIGYRQKFFVQILNPDITFLTFLLSGSDFDSNLASAEFSGLKKSEIGYRYQSPVRISTLSDLSDPNLAKIQIFVSASESNGRLDCPNRQKHLLEFGFVRVELEAYYLNIYHASQFRSERNRRSVAILVLDCLPLVSIFDIVLGE